MVVGRRNSWPARVGDLGIDSMHVGKDFMASSRFTIYCTTLCAADRECAACSSFL